MKPEQWVKVVDMARDEVSTMLEENEDGTLRAFLKGGSKLKIGLTVTIQGKGLSADVDCGISYTVERTKQHGEKQTVYYDQEPLPGMPDPTVAGRAKKGAARG